MGRGIVAARFGKWFGFSVILALLPIIFNIIDAATFNPSLTWGYVLGRGELLLPAVGLSASALGDMVLTDRRWSLFKVVTALACVLNVACASYYFASVSGQYASLDQPNAVVVVRLSILSYVVAVISSASSLYISELERNDERG
jgi:hypothetical protein